MDSNIFNDYYLHNTHSNLTNKINVVIGCGGTGSLFIRDAIRLQSVYNSDKETEEMQTILIDGDLVETKNLKRQNFTPNDVGLNKAQVLARRYSKSFNTNVSYIDKYIESSEGLYNTIKDIVDKKSGGMTVVYIYCFVDNVKTRLMMHNFVQLWRNITEPSFVYFIVDTGNTEYAGQLVLSSDCAQRVDGKTGKRGTLSETEHSPVDYLPDLADPANWDKFASEMSCEEAAVSVPQTMAANATAANLALNTMYSILFDGEIDYHMVTFNVAKNSFRTFRSYCDDYDEIKYIERIEYDGGE